MTVGWTKAAVMVVSQLADFPPGCIPADRNSCLCHDSLRTAARLLKAPETDQWIVHFWRVGRVKYPGGRSHCHTTDAKAKTKFRTWKELTLITFFFLSNGEGKVRCSRND